MQGGTDVDAPLIRSLEQLDREEWAQADIMMVTDGEIRMPGEEVQTCVPSFASPGALSLCDYYGQILPLFRLILCFALHLSGCAINLARLIIIMVLYVLLLLICHVLC